jgi:glycine cleavage system transcriptional repressor
MSELAVTAIGADRPGIVAAVARVLHDRGGNVLDSAMTILAGQFAIMLLVETDDDPDALRDALFAGGGELALTVTVTPAGTSNAPSDPTHVLSVYGSDRPGIMAGVAEALADVGANITDLETRVLSASDAPVYAMVIELATADAERVAAVLDDVCARLGVDHTLRALETETY